MKDAAIARPQKNTSLMLNTNNTRDEIATSIILEAIDSLKGDDSITIEYEEGEETEAVETSTMIINPRNEYFLRFTENAEGDLQRGTSMFKTGRMDEAFRFMRF